MGQKPNTYFLFSIMTSNPPTLPSLALGLGLRPYGVPCSSRLTALRVHFQLLGTACGAQQSAVQPPPAPPPRVRPGPLTARSRRTRTRHALTALCLCLLQSLCLERRSSSLLPGQILPTLKNSSRVISPEMPVLHLTGTCPPIPE